MCDICNDYKVMTVTVGDKEVCFKCIEDKRCQAILSMI